MRLAAAALALGLVAGCAAELDVADGEQAIIGGTTAPLDDSVVLMSVGCTGTLVRSNVVLTAAHCLSDLGFVGFGPDADNLFATRPFIQQFQSRRYSSGIDAGGDMALLRLGSDAPPEVPLQPMNRRPLTDDDVGAEIRTVGYGRTSGTGSDYGTKRQITHNILGVDGEFVGMGDDTTNTCQGDSGGPTYLKNDLGVEEIIAVTSFGLAGCRGYSHITRVDVYLDEFIDEVISAWNGPCAQDGTCAAGCTEFIDPDCDTCGFDGVCATGCAKKDLDCPYSGEPGDLCDDREDCESLVCVAGLDDPRVHYCSVECDGTCPPPLFHCQEAEGGIDACFYDGISPSAQGYECDTGADCRSGICDPDDSICVEQCGDGLPACAEGYQCSELDGFQLCRQPPDGGCRLGGDRRGAWAGSLLLVLAVFLAARRLPKRRGS